MRIGNLRKVIKLINGLNRDDKVLIITHRRADADAYVSAYLLSLMLKSRGITYKVLIPQGISTRILNLTKIIPFKYVTSEEEVESNNLSIFLDIGGPGTIPGLEPLLSKANKSLLLDHHYHQRNFLSLFNEVYVNNTDYSSTCEIVYDVGIRVSSNFKSLLSYNDILALISAILIESRFLQLAKSKTLLRIYEITKNIKSESILMDAFSIIRPKIDRSEKIAMLKGMQRLEIYEAGDYLIAISHLSSYQSSLAAKLLGLGADIAVVFGITDNECKLSVRVSEEIKRELGIHAVKTFIEKMNKYVECQGGGHEGSSMITFKCKDKDLEYARKLIISVLSDILAVHRLKLVSLS